jgi:prepilin-type N-terminal cleavage/methylation domain-containing protein
MFKFSKIKNEAGFTLLEIMIAVGIMGVLSLAFMNISKQSTKASAKFQSDIDATTAANEIMGYLSDPLVCSLATNLGLRDTTGLPGADVSAVFTQITRKNGSAAYVVGGGPYGSSNLMIQSYKFRDTTADDVDSTATPGQRELYLVITFNKKAINQTAVSPTTFERKIKISFQTTVSDTTRIISFCKAVSMGYDGIWTRVIGANDIYFSGGNVGILTATPAANLSIGASGTNTQGISVTKGAGETGISVIGGEGIVSNATDASGAGLNSSGYFGVRAQSNSAVANGAAVRAVSTGVTSFGVLATGTSYGVSAGGIGGSNGGGIRATADGTGTGGYFTSVSGPAIATGTGYVGIGTSTPSVLLDVVTTGFTTFLRGSYAGGQTLQLAAGSVGAAIVQVGTGPLSFHTNSDGNLATPSNPRLTIANNGNVGIGTSTPGFLLDVNGQINTTGRITIPNQVTNLASEYGATAAMTEAATKKWVQTQIAQQLISTDPTTLSNVASAITTFATTNTMDVIRNNVCTNSQIRLNTGAYVAGTYAGATCSYNLTFLDCTVAYSCTNVYAASLIYTPGSVYGTNVCTLAYGCNTRFGRNACPPNTYMYGISNGYPLCTTDPARPGATPGWAAAPALNY